MTEEESKLISEYMGWDIEPYWWCEKCKEEKAPHHATYAERCSDCGCPVILKDDHNFDANDAALCVQEMQKRGGDYVKFIKHAYDMAFDDGKTQFHTVTAWLFNAENFFAAMAAYLKEGKK